MPIRKDDEVLIVRGKYKGREGKVVQVGHQFALYNPHSDTEYLYSSQLPCQDCHGAWPVFRTKESVLFGVREGM
jgi:hypothetical protein